MLSPSQNKVFTYLLTYLLVDRYQTGGQTHIDRPTERQNIQTRQKPDRQTDGRMLRQTDRQMTDRQTDRQTDR